ncbi:hypothetical protein P280DRAFT_484594 [Massarina eburnea CBS 473.64]|uniref:Uncharacterized protein n=1 Tax=Massarina eburnea CBS 473.64 TaxID=1395130 RepID=A0A6A6RN27_9PLEO|nr:hypothetical protein P280DRAFT_484594 [Massarina eburnea CBS 473.64]
MTDWPFVVSPIVCSSLLIAALPTLPYNDHPSPSVPLQSDSVFLEMEAAGNNPEMHRRGLAPPASLYGARVHTSVTELDLLDHEYGEDDWAEETEPSRFGLMDVDHRLAITMVAPFVMLDEFSQNEAFEVFYPYKDLGSGLDTRTRRMEKYYDRFKISLDEEFGNLSTQIPDTVPTTGQLKWRWSKGRLRMHSEAGMVINPTSLTDPYHPLWSEAPPLSINRELWKPFGFISAAELMTYLEYTGRLNGEGGWGNTQIITFINRARNLTGPVAFKLSTLNKYGALRKKSLPHRTTPLLTTLIEDWTPVTLPVQEVEPEIDYYVWDLAAGVPFENWPKGEDRGSMTRVLDLLRTWPACRDLVRLANLPLFLSMFGPEVALGMGLREDLDRRCLGRHAAGLARWAKEVKNGGS